MTENQKLEGIVEVKKIPIYSPVQITWTRIHEYDGKNAPETESHEAVLFSLRFPNEGGTYLDFACRVNDNVGLIPLRIRKINGKEKLDINNDADLIYISPTSERYGPMDKTLRRSQL